MGTPFSYATKVRQFWAKTRPEGECLAWTGVINPRSGYGRMSLLCKRRIPAHRFAYESSIGPIPDGYQIDHLCRNRSCVNPAHLEIVTPEENKRRGLLPIINSMRIFQLECKRGHSLSGANVYIADGHRQCIACRTERDRLRYLQSKREGSGASA